jgi:hypothetical protein
MNLLSKIEVAGGVTAMAFAAFMASKIAFGQQPAPQLNLPSPPTVSACGTSPSVSAGSSSQGGQITAGTASPTTCTWAFNPAWPNNAYCVFSLGTTGPTNPYISAQSKSAITITWTTGTNGVIINYNCEGN